MRKYKTGSSVLIKSRRPNTFDKECKVVDNFRYGGFDYYLVKIPGIIKPLPYAENEIQYIGHQLDIPFGKENLSEGCSVKYHDGKYVCHAKVVDVMDHGVKVKDKWNSQYNIIDYGQIFHISE